MKKNFRYLLSLFITCIIPLSGCEDLNDFDEPGNLVPKTVNEDPNLPYIEVNRTKLHAETFGDIHNPIIIFLHGGPGCDYRDLISQIGVENASRYPSERKINNGGLSQLQDEYYCVFYDQRGAGLSPRFDYGKVNFQIYLNDLDEIISYYLKKKENETGITDNQVYVFGYSYGGTLVTGYINKYPDRIKAVATYEPGPFSKKGYDYFFKHTTSYFNQIGKDWLEELLLSTDHFSDDDHIRADYRSILGAMRSCPEFHENPNCPMWRNGSLIGMEDLELQDRDNTSNLNSFNGKFIFISGELTRKSYGRKYSEIQMSYYKNSAYTEIAGVGHTGPWEKSGELAGILRAFFK